MLFFKTNFWLKCSFRSRQTPPPICLKNPPLCTPNQRTASTRAPPPARTLQRRCATARPTPCPITSRSTRNRPVRSRTTRSWPIRSRKCRWSRFRQSSTTTCRWATGASTTRKDWKWVVVVQFKIFNMFF